jgi:phenylacetate-CoA ligase
MAEYFDPLETRDPEAREKAQMAALATQVAHAKAKAPYFTRLLAGIDPREVTDRRGLARLPVTRKSALGHLQGEAPPFGGLLATPPRALGWLFLSPGPIADPGGRGGDWFRFARALFAAGFRAGHIVHNAFSYHFTPAGLMCDAAARHLGCAVFPGGVGQTEAQVQAIAYFRADGYVGTPDFLRIILEKARETGSDIASLKRALVGGGALPPSLRQAIRALGVNVLQSYGTADLGLVAYESEALDGMIVDEGVIVEIVRPGTGDPVPAGEVGEVVVTSLSPDYPLIRFATGDLSALMAGPSPCGRTGPRIRGWMGRADQTTKVRGMFVHPEQVDQVIKAHGAIAKARLVVTSVEGLDAMTLYCEVANPAAGLAAAIDASLQALCRVRGQVELVPPGSLANDGKVIEDARKYD